MPAPHGAGAGFRRRPFSGRLIFCPLRRANHGGPRPSAHTPQCDAEHRPPQGLADSSDMRDSTHWHGRVHLARNAPRPRHWIVGQHQHAQAHRNRTPAGRHVPGGICRLMAGPPVLAGPLSRRRHCPAAAPARERHPRSVDRYLARQGHRRGHRRACGGRHGSPAARPAGHGHRRAPGHARR
ncbi:Hypothetical Protein RRSL_01462 [Ralstonia solanacearum UW551]|uniref:Uncharacterized protein n=1 Tax=Ralstonia solanacearum (strain UW551) TaxID=342110 RepID=A0AB33VBJ4_RALSU|nr:Hypothetical Protein RRSL_01462 [Ralstonia solanacearum UW551]